jgi:large subunit ribosomal protein L25
MKLAVKKREAGKKINQLRREGLVPAILYGRNHKGQPVLVKKDEFQAIIRNMQPGLLATTIFELHGEEKNHRAMVKEVQYQPATYDIEHIDFAMVDDTHPIKAKVPVRLSGVTECAGVKVGGMIRQVIQTLEVRCLAKNLPKEFTIDVKDMDIGHSKTISDLGLPANVTPIAKDLKQVVVTIGKLAGAAAT